MGYELRGKGLPMIWRPYPEPWEDPKDGTRNSGLEYSYGGDYRALLGGSIFWILKGSG